MRLEFKNEPIQQIPLADLKPGPWQPRRLFDEEALRELASSIRSHGVLTPLRVVPKHVGNSYLIVAGERRWRAANIVGLTELPCIVMDRDIKDTSLRELAVLDNLHRANLRPGEEVRAVANLDCWGMKRQDIIEQLGKSPTWVSQRLAMSKLPDTALAYLDNGTITREEAITLCKLIEYPDLLEACLEPEGELLKTRLAAHVPHGIGERARAVMRVLEMEREQEDWARKMTSEGHHLLARVPRDGDHRYIKLIQGSEAARAHQEARLSCEAWAWEHGRPVRYCTNPQALQEAIARFPERDPYKRLKQEERQRILEREAARDAIIKAWLATSRALEDGELVMLARERISTLIQSDERLLGRLGVWLGGNGNRAESTKLTKFELDTAGERRLIQLWFLIEAAHAMSHSVIPSWLEPWLKELGFADPSEQDPIGRIKADDNGSRPKSGSYLNFLEVYCEKQDQ